MTSVAFLCSIVGGKSHASGFGLKLSSGILAGQANAGSAVIDDPLATATNPATAILQCKVGAALQATGVLPHVRFKGRTSDPLFVNTFRDIKSRQAAKKAVVPSGAIVARLHDRVALGVASYAPFGLQFNYGRQWGGNRYVIKDSLKTININPTLAFKFHEMFSIGAGFQAQRSSAILSSQTASSIPLVQAILQQLETQKRAKIEGWGYGWTAGFLLQPTKCLKVGFSYRSEIKTSLRGRVRFRNVPPPLAPVLQNSHVKSKLRYPRIFTLSASYNFTPKWTALFDIIRTNWSSINQIILATPSNPIAEVIQQKWKDNWFFSGGINYQYSPCWLFRAGVAYDRRASRTSYRVPGIPDNDKIWAAAGMTYALNKALSMSLSYGHEFFRKVRINLRQGNLGNAGKGNLIGHIREHVDLISLQVNYQY